MVFQDCCFFQEDEAAPWVDFLREHGAFALLAELDAAGALGSDGETRSEDPAGSGDWVTQIEYLGHQFSIAYNYGLPYLGVCEIVDPDE